MVKADAILAKVISGHGRIQFRDFQKLLVGLGFRLDRTRGSHHIYVHPKIGRSFPVQPDGPDAKRYQVKQLRDMIETYKLTL
jgi:predicted RNA binding protein YcfA (HicA-like mRNA interferase family)